MTDAARYVVALACGHATYETRESVASLEWCPSCSGYVGVIVQRVDLAGAQRDPDS